jgi:hypothetical protein
MKASDATSNDQNCEKRQAHGATFAKVLDGRTRYHARLNVENPLTGIKKNQRVPLVTKNGIPGWECDKARWRRDVSNWKRRAAGGQNGADNWLTVSKVAFIANPVGIGKKNGSFKACGKCQI